MSDRSKRAMKIVLTGNNFIEKSSLVRRYVDNDNERWCNYNKKELVLKGCKVALELWATFGAREFRTEEQYRGADGCIIVFSVTNRKSFEDLNLWRNELFSLGKPQNPEQFPFVVVGTKIEVEADRTVTKEEAQQWCDSFSIPYFECSSKAGTNVKEAFETIIAKVFDSQKRPNL